MVEVVMGSNPIEPLLLSPSPGLFVMLWCHLVPVSRIIKKPASAGGLFWGILSA